MLTLDNFEETVDRKILNRGRQYFLSQYVVHLEEIADNHWQAEVEGTEVYTVDVHLKGREITKYSCNCPYDGLTCKHVVSVFLALRKDVKKIKEKTKPKKGKKLTMQELLSKISTKELQDFILHYASLNKDFARVIEIHFAEKDERIDMQKHYLDIIKKMIRKNSDHGFIDYRSSIALSREADKLIDEGSAFAQKGKFAEAMLIGQLVVSELIEVIGDSDDSSGSLGGTIDGAIELLADIGSSEEVSFSLKVLLFDFLEKEAMKKNYYDYGDFGLGLLDVAQDVAMQIGETERFIKLTDAILPLFSGYFFDFYKEQLLVRKIAVLEKLGQTEEIQQLMNVNMDLVSLRKQALQEAINKKDYIKAKQLIREGIQIAESKNRPGTVADWERELLAIAILEKDLATIRAYTKKFAFERGNFDVTYYRQWKGTFSEKEWEEELQKIIIGVYKEAEANEKDKKSMWFNAKDFIFDRLAPLFVEEQMWDRLLELTKHTGSFNALYRVHEHLVKRYPKEVLDMYMPTLRKKSEGLNGRREYQDFAQLLQKLKKDIPDGKQEIGNFIAELKVKYAKRPAMIEELNKIK
ncbi:MAG: hypothetical protein Fur004_03170 [Thermoflexibacter sp.]